MKREEKMIFAVSPRDDGQDILLGIPTAAWEYMKDGKTHTFDLTKLGLPIRIIVYGGPDHDTLIDYVRQHNKSLGLQVVEVLDLRDKDFSV